MILYNFIILAVCLGLFSCTSHQLPAFSKQHWHTDTYTGHTVSSAGLELAFGSDWMIQDTTLMQSIRNIEEFPKLKEHLALGIAQFPEIQVDSILFYHPGRALLFATYHQIKPLKPTSEIYLYDETTEAYSKEHARIFGIQYTLVDEDGWENGPSNSAYLNVHYRPKNKSIVLLSRISFVDADIAIFQIIKTLPKRGKWWMNYPRGTFLNTDLGDTDNIEKIAQILLSTRNLAVENLKLSKSK